MFLRALTYKGAGRYCSHLSGQGLKWQDPSWFLHLLHLQLFLESLASSRLWAYLWVHLLIIEFFGLDFFQSDLHWLGFSKDTTRFRQCSNPTPRETTYQLKGKNQDHRGVWDTGALPTGWSSWFAVSKKGHQISSNWMLRGIIILSEALNAEVKLRIPPLLEGTVRSDPIPSSQLPSLLHIKEVLWFDKTTTHFHWISPGVPSPACKVLCLYYLEFHPL